MATWDVNYEAAPSGAAAPSTIDDRIREDRTEVRARLDREHTILNTTQSGGYHRAGGAKIYCTTAAPTTRPDGTALDSTDKGRLWMSSASSASKLFIYTGSAWASMGGVGVGVVYETKSANTTGITAATSWTLAVAKVGGFSFTPKAIVAATLFFSTPAGGREVITLGRPDTRLTTGNPANNVSLRLVGLSIGAASVGLNYYHWRATSQETGCVAKATITAVG